MKQTTWILSAAFVAVATIIAVPAARADHDIRFGINTPIGNDANLFFSISSRYFDRDQRVVTDWGRRYTNPDDLAVFLFICAHSQEKPEGIDYYRRKGLSWYEVAVRANVPMNVWYVTMDGPPRGRYARPYGHWNQHQQDPRHVVRFSDREARDLVAVRMAHEYYGVTPQIAMNWRNNGTNVRTIMTREYRSRHRDDDRRQDGRYDQQDRNRGN